MCQTIVHTQFDSLLDDICLVIEIRGVLIFMITFPSTAALVAKFATSLGSNELRSQSGYRYNQGN